MSTKRLTRAALQALASEYQKTGPDLRHPHPGGEDDGEEAEGSRESALLPRPTQAEIRTASKKANAALAKLLASDPAFKGLKLKAPLQLVPPARKENIQGRWHVIERILTVAGANESQSEIARSLRALHASISIPKDWTKQLPPATSRKLRERVQASPPPFNTIKVNGRTTLSSLHRAARRRAAQFAVDGARVRAEIVVTADRVFINEHSWKITGEARRVIIPVKRLLDMRHR